MKGSKISITLLVGILLIAATACGKSLVKDDFNDNAINSSYWTTLPSGTGPTVNEINQQLEIFFPADCSNDPVSGAFGEGYQNLCQLNGDFDIQVDYTLITWPPKNGVRIGLGISEVPIEPGVGCIPVERISFGKYEHTGWPQEVYLADFGDGQYGITATSNLSGKLKLVRAGTSLSGYYYNNGDWILVHSVPITVANVYIVLAAWSHDGVFAYQNVKIAFDNFVVNKGLLVSGSPTATLTPTPTTKYTPGPTPEAGSSTPTLTPFTPVPLPCADWFDQGNWIGGCCDNNRNGKYDSNECYGHSPTPSPTPTPTPTSTH